MLDKAKKPLTKSELLNTLAERTDLTKQQLAGFFEEFGKMIEENLAEQGPGILNVPGLMKIRVQRKEATPERTGINPFTKEETVFKAKPARNVVKITPLKALKDRIS